MLGLRKLMVVTISVAALALAGCLGGSDDKKEESTPETPKAAATARLALAVNSAVSAISSVTESSTAVNILVADGMVAIPATPKLKEQILSRARSFTASPLGRRFSGRVALHADEVHAESEMGITDDYIADFLGVGVESGNTITYPLNAATFCADEYNDPYTPENEVTECYAEAALISVVQTVVDDNTGTLTIKIGDAAPIVIGYGANEVYLEVDFAEVKAAATAMGAEIQFGTTVEGAVRLTLEVINSTAGSESVAITLGVTTAINLAGTDSDGAFSLQIDASDDLFQISADAGAGSATVSLDVGQIHFTFPETADVIVTPGLFHLGGLTGSVTLSNGGDTLTGTNIGITGEFYYDSNTSDPPAKELTITLPAFGFVVDGPTSTIEITSSAGFDLDLADDFVDPADDGTLAMTAPMGTEIMVMEDMYGMVTYMVMDGSVNVTGTGTWNDGGPINATSTSNSCFDDDVMTLFPFQTADCPVM